MTEPTELLPCPFCGGTPTTIERPDNIDGTQFFYAIACYCGRHSACAHKMAVRKTPEIAKADAVAAWNTRTPQPTQAQAGAVPLTPWMKPGQFFGGRPERAMEIDATDFYGVTEAIHHALEMLEKHPKAGTDFSPLDPKRSRRLRQALMAAWMLEYPEEAASHGIKGGRDVDHPV